MPIGPWIKSLSLTRPFPVRFKARTVRERLLVLIVILLGAISCFIYLFFPGAIEEQALNGIETKARSIGAMAAHSVASAVLFDQRQDMEDALRGALQNDDVIRVEVADMAGTVLVSLVPEGRSLDAATIRSTGVYSSSSPVLSGEDQIANVRLQLSLAEMRAQVARARGLVALVSLAIFALGILVAIGISAHVTGPLRAVAAAAERIAQGDLGSRAEASTEDEVGQMARSFNDMVDRLQAAHQEVAGAKGQLEQVLDNIPADVVMYDPDGHYLYANPAAIPDEGERRWVLTRTPLEYNERLGLGRSSGQTAIDAVTRCVQERRLINTEQSLPGPDGTERELVRFFSPILNEADEVSRVISFGLDITDLREAEAELRDTQERLLQAQKMESIGRLAGGIAHDFNNLLTTITGNADLILMDLPQDDPSRGDVNEIHRAAERASSLTQQLLAFSRKQVTQPKVFCLNDTVVGIQKLLQRLIGEDIKLSTQLTEELGNIKADPGQIEQVIVNLAVNSRDAMPRGGAMTIRTEKLSFEEDQEGPYDETLPAGDYSMISVSDTGIGMDDETRDRIFEPFFTKKGPGKGTGLGLATVYGIVRQAKGYIKVYSEMGMGTTFKVFLPRVEEAAEPVVQETVTASLTKGSETILVAEDQEGVRVMTQKILERCGYHVLAADGPKEALKIAEECSHPIDLILTDVVMPDMSGPELVEKLGPILPNKPVIFMSGYTDDQLQHHGVLDDDVVLIEKPFTAQNLSRIIRSVLDTTEGKEGLARSA